MVGDTVLGEIVFAGSGGRIDPFGTRSGLIPMDTIQDLSQTGPSFGPLPFPFLFQLKKKEILVQPEIQQVTGATV